MDPARLEAIGDLFAAARERPPAEREVWLGTACPDPDLRAEVERLLRADASAEPYFDDLVGQVAASGLLEVEATTRVRQLVGAYRTLEVIGRGGMGTVFLAERDDGQFDQRVALKLVRLGMDDDAAMQRFLAERQIVARLDHPNIARLLDGGVTGDGQPYFVMEHVAGHPITTHCDEARLSIDARLRLFLDVGHAVQYAHGHLVVHRDVKPANVLVTGDGRVKLLDFGIAKLLDAERGAHAAAGATRTRERVLTPAHAAPEQIRGEPITTAADVYALGVLLYELLAGRRPHEPDGLPPAEFERRVLEDDPPRPSEAVLDDETAAGRGTRPDRLRRVLSGDLDVICATALRKEPARRYRSVDQLLEDVRRYLDGLPIAAQPDTVAYRARKFVRRHRVGVAMTAAILALTVGFAAVLAVQSVRVAQERDKAEQVASLFIDLFEVADPGETRGASITAREVLDRGIARIQAGLGDQPEVQAALLEVIGRVYRNLGLYERATPLMEGALDARRRTFGGPHPEVAAAMRELGELMRLRGEFTAAEELLRETVALEQQLGVARSPGAARTRNHLGKTLIARGQLEEAEQVLHEAMTIARAALGEDHEEVAESLNNVAAIRFMRGDDTGAEPLFRQALDIRRARLGRDHPSVPAVLNNLGSLLSRKGEYAEAEAAYAEALDLYERIFGSEHPHVATAMNNLALSRFARQDVAAAEPLLRASLDLRRRLLPPAHPDIAQSASNLGLLLQTTGRSEDAEALYREALELRSQAVGEAHPLFAQSLNNLALLRQAQGDTGGARGLFERALSILEAALGPRHALVATTHHNLGALYQARGDASSAARHYAAALEIREAVLPDGHPERAATAARLDEVRAGRQ